MHLCTICSNLEEFFEREKIEKKKCISLVNILYLCFNEYCLVSMIRSASMSRTSLFCTLSNSQNKEPQETVLGDRVGGGGGGVRGKGGGS